MAQPEIKITFMSWNFSVRGGKKYVKHASDSHAKKKERYEKLEQTMRARSVGRSVSGNIRYGIRGYRGTRHWSRRSTLAIRTNFPRISRAGSTASYTCAILRTLLPDVVGTREIYSARNKILVKPLRRSVIRLYAPSIRQFRGIFDRFGRRKNTFHYSTIIVYLMQTKYNDIHINIYIIIFSLLNILK